MPIAKTLALALGLLLALSVIGLGVGPRALAQDPGSVQLAVFPVASDDASVATLANVVAQALTTGLQKYPQIQVGARPALDLPGTSLALGCDVTSDECLRAATALARTQALLAPSLERSPEREIVVTLLHFDALGGGSRTVSRRSPPSGEPQLKEAIASMLQELFAPGGAPPASDAGAGAGLEPAPLPADTHEHEASTLLEPTAFLERRSAPILPIAMTAVGGIVLGTGVAFGVLARASEQDYANTPVMSAAQIDSAADKLAAARLQATLCNWGMGIGGALLAAGITLWILHYPSTPIDSPSANAATPAGTPALSATVDPGGAALMLKTRF